MDRQRQVPTQQRASSSAPPNNTSRGTQWSLWWSSRSGRAMLLGGTLLIGMLIGVLAPLLYVLSISKDGSVIATPPSSANGAIVIQVSSTYMAQLLERKLKTAGIPGTITNVQVTMVANGPITVLADDQLISAFGVGFTRRFTLTLQPLVRSCQLQIHVLHADLSGIPITGFVATFENTINQQLQATSSNLPQGFAYCTTGVRTGSGAMSILYSATPE